MRMILAASPLLKEVIGWDSRGGWPGSDHGDLSRLDAIEGDASHMPTTPASMWFGTVLYDMVRCAFNCYLVELSSVHLLRMRASHMPALATSSTPKATSAALLLLVPTKTLRIGAAPTFQIPCRINSWFDSLLMVM